MQGRWSAVPAANADAGLGPLRRALTIRLTPGEWERFAVLLGHLESAWSAADMSRFDNAAVQLDRALHRRARRLGEEPLVLMTPPVRERVNRMVHVLTDSVGAQDHQPEESGQASADGDTATGR